MLLINIVSQAKHEVLYMVDKVIGFKIARLIRKGAGLVIAKAIFNAFKLA